ncbi:FeoB-associated Cys-rich membrane protein [uncultured Sphaerochaeta sp.]|uniref:FeoB-associated Cys-rich membrane protein n=1 Tax=uncultured Sphaerochaeta sp. TaxID=886478 RepID=UPI002A0A54C4|nr:FeoB-associated Cys-rich membrane protein [uncultured Sphaerochaeta sp.]
MTVLANIIVALVIVLFLGLAIRTIYRQRKEGGCGSCKKCIASCDGNHTCPSSGCKGCEFSGTCHK